MLAVALDGYTHRFEEVADRDELKEQRLNEIGIRVLRFKDEDVMDNIEGVIAEIKEWIKAHTP
jgi:very-short-patch-repair endonuclease